MARDFPTIVKEQSNVLYVILKVLGGRMAQQERDGKAGQPLEYKAEDPLVRQYIEWEEETQAQLMEYYHDKKIGDWKPSPQQLAQVPPQFRENLTTPEGYIGYYEANIADTGVRRYLSDKAYTNDEAGMRNIQSDYEQLMLQLEDLRYAAAEQESKQGKWATDALNGVLGKGKGGAGIG